jgi:hypothetical protein
LTIGLVKVAGAVKLDGSDSANSSFDLTIYSAASKAPPLKEEGKIKDQWVVTHANHTLVCFHSKGVYLRLTPAGSAAPVTSEN